MATLIIHASDNLNEIFNDFALNDNVKVIVSEQGHENEILKGPFKIPELIFEGE